MEKIVMNHIWGNAPKMSLSQLKKDVSVLHKALNINQAVPAWKKQQVKIELLLKEWEVVPEEEKDQVNREVLAWYEVVSQNI